MHQCCVSTEIQASPERVWDVFTDLGITQHVLSSVSRVELLTLGEMEKGSRWREHRKQFFTTQIRDVEIVEFVPVENLTIRSAHNNLEYDIAVSLEPTPMGTLVTCEFSGQWCSHERHRSYGWWPARNVALASIRQLMLRDLTDYRNAVEYGLGEDSVSERTPRVIVSSPPVLGGELARAAARARAEAMIAEIAAGPLPAPLPALDGGGYVIADPKAAEEAAEDAPWRKPPSDVRPEDYEAPQMPSVAPSIEDEDFEEYIAELGDGELGDGDEPPTMPGPSSPAMGDAFDASDDDADESVPSPVDVDLNEDIMDEDDDDSVPASIRAALPRPVGSVPTARTAEEPVTHEQSDSNDCSDDVDSPSDGDRVPAQKVIERNKKYKRRTKSKRRLRSR